MFRCDLEYAPLEGSAARLGHTKEIAIGILHDRGRRPAVLAAGIRTEAVEHLVGSRSSQFVHGTDSTGSPLGSCAIEVAVSALDWGEIRNGAIDAFGTRTKRMQHLELAGRTDREDYALIELSALEGRAVK